MVTSFLTSPSSIFETGNAGPLGDDTRDVFFVDFFFEHALAALFSICLLSFASSCSACGICP